MSDPRALPGLKAESDALRQRIMELQAEVARLQASVAALSRALRTVRPYFHDHSGEAIMINATLSAKGLDE